MPVRDQSLVVEAMAIAAADLPFPRLGADSLDLVRTAVACQASTKRRQWQVLHHLREHELALVHRSPRRNQFREGRRTLGRRSNRDQERSTVSPIQSTLYSA